DSGFQNQAEQKQRAHIRFLSAAQMMSELQHRFSLFRREDLYQRRRTRTLQNRVRWIKRDSGKLMQPLEEHFDGRHPPRIRLTTAWNAAPMFQPFQKSVQVRRGVAA